MKMREARRADYSNRSYLSDFEGAAYTGLSRTTFRKFAQRIGCRRKVSAGRVLNDRKIIDQALRGGDAVED